MAKATLWVQHHFDVASNSTKQQKVEAVSGLISLVASERDCEKASTVRRDSTKARQTASHARRGLASRGQLANQGISKRRWTFCAFILSNCLQRRTSADELERFLLPETTLRAARACWPVTHLASLVALLVASISISIDCKPRRPFSLPPIILFCHVDVGSWACPGNKHIKISSDS